MNPFELQKTRKLFFSDEPADQVEQAYLLLGGMENLKVEKGTLPNSLVIHYSLEHYTHEALENALIKEGFHFKKSLLDMVQKHVVHYCEDVQHHNLSSPEHPTKKNEAEVFAQVYEHHPHGNHDDTPKNLREYK
ncbi:MAG: hypothetical protein FD173_1966 [Gallionellaceae bacterium]|nr:MAG: hypothetical protein FD173_1966 [Gallionellaceae bacterium]